MKQDIVIKLARWTTGAAATIVAANNYAVSLMGLQRFEEAKSLLRKSMPAARRVLGDSKHITLRMRKVYAKALCDNPGATLDDLREAVTTLEELERTSRRVFGGSHPLTNGIKDDLQKSRDALAVFKLTAAGRGTTRADDVRSLREAVAAMASTKGPGDAQ